jgi:hypothetical protein
MFHQFLEQLTLRVQLARSLRLRRRLTKLDEQLSLKQRFPEHGRYRIGDIEVLRFDADGGVDLRRFMAEHVGQRRTQKYFTMMPDPAKISHAAPQYVKPRVEKVKVAEVRLSR